MGAGEVEVFEAGVVEDWGSVEAAVHQEDVLFDGRTLKVELAGDAGSDDLNAVFRDFAREGIAGPEAEVAEELGADLAVLACVFRRAFSVADEQRPAPDAGHRGGVVPPG